MRARFLIFKIILSLFMIFPIIGLVKVDISRAESMANPADYRISNAALSIGISKRDAGAVSSIIYNGHEFVNDYDHGRQMQVAWVYNEEGDIYNPTEAGSAEDYTKPTSTSKLLSVNIEGNKIITENHPAYWWGPGKGLNAKTVTKDTLKKTITIGYRGDPQVIVFDTVITVSPELTGPPITKIRVVSPALYTSWAMTEHYQFDLRDGTMEKIPVPAGSDMAKSRFIDRMRFNKERKRIPILSSLDERYAIGLYTPQSENFWVYSSYNFPRTPPANACNKVTCRFLHFAETGRTYTYRTFVIVGNLESVKNSARKLP